MLTGERRYVGLFIYGNCNRRIIMGDVMETLFENTCVYTKENLCQLAPRTKYIALIILLGLPGLIMLFLPGEYYKKCGIVLLIGAVFAYVIYHLKGAGVNKTYRRSQEIYHGDQEIKTAFYDDYFMLYNVSERGEIKLEYSRIVKITTTENLYLLVLPENLAIMIDKGGFTKGTGNDFLKFIREKAPTAKTENR